MDTRLHHLQGKAERLTPVVVALGSNLGDRRAHLDWAVDRLATWLGDLRVSAWIETEPAEVIGVQPPYLNGVAVGGTALDPRTLLERLLAIEAERHRERQAWHAPRTLDLDLILYGDHIIDEPRLVIPHPRFRERAFVLEPLAAIAPDVEDPVTRLTVGELLERLRG